MAFCCAMLMTCLCWVRGHLLEHVSTIWSCSPPVPSESGDLSYCGLEISGGQQGLFISQARYVCELLNRHAVQPSADTPCSLWKESYDDSSTRAEDVALPDIRAAQSLLMWLSVARPDIHFRSRGQPSCPRNARGKPSPSTRKCWDPVTSGCCMGLLQRLGGSSISSRG